LSGAAIFIFRACCHKTSYVLVQATYISWLPSVYVRDLIRVELYHNTMSPHAIYFLYHSLRSVALDMISF